MTLRSLVDVLWYAAAPACVCAVLGLVGYGLAALLDWITGAKGTE